MSWLPLFSSGNNNRVTINATTGFMNLSKAWIWQSGGLVGSDPANQTSNGYPLTTPSSNWTGTGFNPANYYGTFTWSWSGQGSMQIPDVPLVVTSGGSVITELGTNSGDLAGNVSIISATAPSVVLAFGWAIQSISQGASNGLGGNLIRINVKTGFLNHDSVPTKLPSVNIAGAVSNTGANGTWEMTNVDATTFAYFDLVGSVFTNAQVSVSGTAIYAENFFSILMLNTGTFSGMSNLVFCKTADVSAVASQHIDNTLLAQYQYLFNNSTAQPANYGSLRFMDLGAVQANFEGDFAERMPTSYLSWTTNRWVPNYWVGNITHGTNDAYTCSAPTNWPGKVDGAIVQGNFAVTNTAGQPTLNVASTGAAPIFDRLCNPWIFRISGPAASAGLTMQWTFSASWFNSNTPYVFSYTTVSGDTVSADALSGNLVAKLQLDTTLTAGGIQFGNSAQVAAFPRTAMAGRMTIAYTSGAAICTMITADVGQITGNSTVVYNAILGGWIYTNDAGSGNGLTQCIPLEVIADYCNRVGAHCWFNWGVTKSGWITGVTNFFATNLNAGLRLGTETGNEIWNAGGGYPWHVYNSLASQLGIPSSSNAAAYSYGALRTIQYAALSKAAWASAGRPASDLYILAPSQTVDTSINGNFDTYQLKGAGLNASTNTIYGTYGGLNGSGTSPSYTTAPNRPVDITTATGCAPYWNSQWMGTNGSSFTEADLSIVGPVSQNIPWLQAALDYSNGLSSTAFTSMVNQFTGVTPRAAGSTGFSLDFPAYQTLFTNQEAMVAQYDSTRPSGMVKLGILDYEGGPSFGIGSNGNNGVNSVNSGDINALATAMGNLGWTTTQLIPYTHSGTGNLTEMATMVFTMLQAWKYDVSYKNMIKTYYYAARKFTSPTREAKPAQYGYAASNWGYFPSTYFTSNQYTSYDATHEFAA